jgi:hypothetical protein
MMKRILVITAALLITTTPAFSQAVAPQATRQLLQRIAQTHLGSVVVKDILAIGEGITPSGKRHPVRFYAQGSKTLRIEHGTGSAQSVSVFSNGSAWESRSGKTQDLPGHVAEQRVRVFPFLDLLSEWNNPDLEVVKSETTTIGNVLAYHIQLRVKDSKRLRPFGRPLDDEADFYINTQTLLIMRSVRMLRAVNDMDFRIPSVMDFADYRNVNGIAIPFRITTTLGTPTTGIHTSTTQLQSVQFNAGVSPALFERGQR